METQGQLANAHLLGIEVRVECPKTADRAAAVVGREVALEQCEAMLRSHFDAELQALIARM